MTKILSYDQTVRLTAWDSMSYARVFTIEGYARKHGDDVATSVARAIEYGHELAATIQLGATLTTSRSFYERERVAAASAETLVPGEVVEIEGRRYEVVVVCGNERAPRNSDPIKFRPVGEEG
jgi:hypothetical protein